MNNGVKRVESPSSINTYNHCPRKYYYTYIAKLPTKGNIHTVKGNVVHSVLENFFNKQVPENVDYENGQQWIKGELFGLFSRFWKEKKVEIQKIEISEAEEAIGIDDCVNMLYLWEEILLKKMKKTGLPFKDALQKLKPIQKEKYFKSSPLSVQGFVDVIENIDGKIRLMDYKTSSSSYVSDEYLLQLGIYALLYQEVYKGIPHEVGIYFLRDESGEKVLKVTPHLLENARKQIRAHHLRTENKDIDNYPQNISYLCKWATGQCSFYDYCFKAKAPENNKKDGAQSRIATNS